MIWHKIIFFIVFISVINLAKGEPLATDTASVTIGEHCGDGICNNDETCSSCSEDCGGCSSGGGSKSPSGGGICMPSWNCTDWSECDGAIQYRDCHDKYNCNGSLKTENQSCTLPEPVEEPIEEPVIEEPEPPKEEIVVEEKKMNWEYPLMLLLLLIGGIYYIIKKNKKNGHQENNNPI